MKSTRLKTTPEPTRTDVAPSRDDAAQRGSPLFSTLPECDELDEPIAAHVYAGKIVVESAIISPENDRYVIRNQDGEILDRTLTSAVAIRLADIYLEGVLQGIRLQQEVFRVPTDSLRRDRRNPSASESDRRDREHDQGATKGDSPG